MYLLSMNHDSLDKGKERPVDKTSYGTEKDDQSHVNKKSFRTNQFADHKDAWERNDGIRKQIREEGPPSHSKVKESSGHGDFNERWKIHEDAEENGHEIRTEPISPYIRTDDFFRNNHLQNTGHKHPREKQRNNCFGKE
jgi:hypothetical protein